MFIQCCQELAVKRPSAFPWAQGCISRQPTEERQIMGRWWKLARNSEMRSIWFWLFIRTSLSVVILDIDPRTFNFHSRNYWGNNLSEQPTSAESVFKSMPGCFLPTRTDSKIGGPFHHITVSSQYPFQRINVCMLLNWALCSFILLRFTKFFYEREAFLLNFYNIFIFYQCWATLMLFWNNKKGWK